jgi:mono/diheme cytochrome c family protein
MRPHPLKVVFPALISTLLLVGVLQAPHANADTRGAGAFKSQIRPILSRYCLGCHSAKTKKGGLDLARFVTEETIRKDLKPWQGVIDHLEVGDMPPFGTPQPSDAEKRKILAWVAGTIAKEAKAQAGDPGFVPMRRLSHSEYNHTIQALTGVDLQPTREFPTEGAAGEGFTNAAEALTDISPTLFSKYFAAAKEIASHAILLPNGFRFSATKNRRDWTDESTARLRAFYAQYADAEGRMPLSQYLTATVRYRSAILAKKRTVEEVATAEKLNPKYLQILWRVLNDSQPSFPLDVIRYRWLQATEQDIPALIGEITTWQNTLWQTVRVGSYMRPVEKGYAESLSRQLPKDLASAAVQPLRVSVKPLPGQEEVSLLLSAKEALSQKAGQILWRNPRFEAPGKQTLFLRDYAQFGRLYEVDFSNVFSKSALYLNAVAEVTQKPHLTLDEVAKRYDLEPTFLQRWSEALALEPLTNEKGTDMPLRVVPNTPLELLGERQGRDNNRPAIQGWHKKGAELPIVLSNSSDVTEHIPGTAEPHSIVVHPTPSESVAVAWRSPITGRIKIRARIKHAHPACGNGVAWRLSQRHGGQTAELAEGSIELGGEARPDEKTRRVERDDLILLAIDAKNADHSCDLTNISLTITPLEEANRTWDLARDIADTIQEGNPHADRFGEKAVWHFVKGAAFLSFASGKPLIPPTSVLGQWREAATDPKRQAEAAELALQVQRLLTSTPPSPEQQQARTLYDNLVTVNSPLFYGVNLSSISKFQSPPLFGLPKERFGGMGEANSLLTSANTIVELRLPAALFRDYGFVVEGALAGEGGDRAVTLQIGAGASDFKRSVEGSQALIASQDSAAQRRLLKGYADFRHCFPLFLCFSGVIPNDEVVSLKMFHREDEPLLSLFLNPQESETLERLWTEHRFISRQPIAENTYLPLFIGFVTQDQPKEMVAYFEGQRPAFKARVDAFLKEEQSAIPKQMEALLDFASRAYRRPLLAKEKSDLFTMYRSIQAKGATHEEAFQGLLARILTAPAFLFRGESAPSGSSPGAVSDWELATRLSYFLWASAPDAELRRLAASGKLRSPATLTAQTHRMLKDSRVRALAEEFGAQWLHVRGFDSLNEKNERLFPTFNADLRKAIYEETLLFFQDMFQADRPVSRILDADYTFLNETLAKHYDIPNVKGEEWRRVEGVRRYGRGGLLGLASIQAKESGASRTSPVLRGNWVVETLLGEKLPRPPANVPRLPEEEGNEGLTVRQLVERHARVPSCASCHRRIDPFGFALERYDPIGRLRLNDLGGKPVDSKAKLKDGTEFEGIEGLRNYLLKQKKDVILRLFCRRLLGYALGRSVAPPDQPLIDQMMHAMRANKGRFSAVALTIVQSPQFQRIRGQGFHVTKGSPPKLRQTGRFPREKTTISSR